MPFGQLLQMTGSHASRYTGFTRSASERSSMPIGTFLPPRNDRQSEKQSSAVVSLLKICSSPA